jgi:hypothetical protein
MKNLYIGRLMALSNRCIMGAFISRMDRRPLQLQKIMGHTQPPTQDQIFLY